MMIIREPARMIVDTLSMIMLLIIKTIYGIISQKPFSIEIRLVSFSSGMTRIYLLKDLIIQS